MKYFTKLFAALMCTAAVLSCSSANPSNTEEGITNDKANRIDKNKDRKINIKTPTL